MGKNVKPGAECAPLLSDSLKYLLKAGVSGGIGKLMPAMLKMRATLR